MSRRVALSEREQLELALLLSKIEFEEEAQDRETRRAASSPRGQPGGQAGPSAAPRPGGSAAPRAEPSAAPRAEPSAASPAGANAAPRAGPSAAPRADPPADPCAICKQDLGNVGYVLHPTTKLKIHNHCFRCHVCKRPIGCNFSRSPDNDSLFPHPECKPETRPQKKASEHVCRVCGDKTHYFYVSHFWKDEYCVRHGSDGTPQCDSCGRMRAKGAPDFLPVDDNRAICHPCTATVLMDTLEARPLYNQVLEFFKSKGMALSVAPSMGLVGRTALNEARAKSKGCSFTCGMTFSERTWRAGGPVEVFVTGILVLKGYTRLRTGAIMAHECMHAWLRYEHIDGMARDDEEGMCELMGFLWLESQCHAGASSSRASDDGMRDYLKQRLEENTDPVYGGGLRKALRAYRAFGLQRLVNHVRGAKALP